MYCTFIRLFLAQPFLAHPNWIDTFGQISTSHDLSWKITPGNPGEVKYLLYNCYNFTRYMVPIGHSWSPAGEPPTSRCHVKRFHFVSLNAAIHNMYYIYFFILVQPLQTLVKFIPSVQAKICVPPIELPLQVVTKLTPFWNSRCFVRWQPPRLKKGGIHIALRERFASIRKDANKISWLKNFCDLLLEHAWNQ